MKKPVKPKYPKKPTLPKGGIKNENQLQAYEKKVSDYKKKVALLDATFKKEEAKYNAFVKKVIAAKNKLK